MIIILETGTRHIVPDCKMYQSDSPSCRSISRRLDDGVHWSSPSSVPAGRFVPEHTGTSVAAHVQQQRRRCRRAEESSGKVTIGRKRREPPTRRAFISSNEQNMERLPGKTFYEHSLHGNGKNHKKAAFLKSKDDQKPKRPGKLAKWHPPLPLNSLSLEKRKKSWSFWLITFRSHWLLSNYPHFHSKFPFSSTKNFQNFSFIGGN